MKNKRPLPLRLLPPALRMPFYYRFWRGGAAERAGLFREAALHFAPGVRMDLVPGDELHGCIAFTGIYEPELSRRIARHAREGGLMVDVGANYGYFSLLWAAGAPENRVVAFEASPRNLPGLRRNVELNGLAGRIRVEPRAAGREEGLLDFDPGPPEQTGWGGVTRAGGEGMVRVECVRLDGALADVERIDVLKIDVEGADAWVIEGAAELLRSRRVRHVYFELNKPRMRLLEIADDTAVSCLRDAGYRVEALDDPDGEAVEFHAEPE
jgi:FkbM family methyltransferase